MQILAAKRFSKYTVVGGAAFALDLVLLFLFTDALGWPPVLSAAVAFVLAVSLNYVLSRYFVFKGTTRGFAAGYAGFLVIALSGLGIVTGMMHVFVDILAWNYLLSRISIALFTGIWNYLLNLYFNFRVAGSNM